ncbi:unnamed protein product [Moneuplotes crassus]|uniref:Uncharacterized protein n=1 Tax=Euplotes crassus TaxID=5936 RepID=A0AAD1UB96_EUPCR|nr:unnamed protein product [Moneuplotes crassus]
MKAKSGRGSAQSKSPTRVVTPNGVKRVIKFGEEVPSKVHLDGGSDCYISCTSIEVLSQFIALVLQV